LKQAAGVDAKTDLRETGAHKTIAGCDARQLLFTMDVPTVTQGVKVTVRMEAEIWLADVPGSAEMTAFQKAGGSQLLGSRAGASGLEKSLADLERTLEQRGGVPVLQIVRIRMGNAAPLMEITTEMSQFSTKAIPASRFAVPAGYQLVKPTATPR
jgi:hypothetical protein